MTDNEINIAVAEACGAHGWWEGFCFFGKDKRRSPCPDYCGDLNAMNEAEKTLQSESLQRDYIRRLWMIVGEPKYKDSPQWAYWRVLHATARQRAEAFLRTLGKWRGE